MGLSAREAVASPNDNTIATDHHFATIAAHRPWWWPSAGEAGLHSAAAIALERKKRTSSCCPPRWCLCDDEIVITDVVLGKG